MRYLLLAVMALLVSPAMAQNCPGQTFSENFQAGAGAWQSTISAGNTATINPSNATAGPSGLTLNAGPSYGSWLENTNFKQTYGAFKATVNVSSGMLASGMTSAVWLLADHTAPGSNQSWPAEIDFWETAGAVLDVAMHSGFTPDNAGAWYYNIAPGEHTVTVDWEPDKITWYLDNQQFQQRPTPPDFNTPMHFILDAMNQGSNASGSMTVQSLQAFDNAQHAIACGGTGSPSSGPIATAFPDQQPTPAEPSSSPSLPSSTDATPCDPTSHLAGPLADVIKVCADPAVSGNAINKALCADAQQAEALIGQATTRLQQASVGVTPASLPPPPSCQTLANIPDAPADQLANPPLTQSINIPPNITTTRASGMSSRNDYHQSHPQTIGPNRGVGQSNEGH